MIDFILSFVDRVLNRISTYYYMLLLPHMVKSSKIYLDASFKGVNCIFIGKNTVIEKHSVIKTYSHYLNDYFTPQIIIGDNVNIGEYCHITCIKSVQIGNNVLTGRRVTISDNNHGSFWKEQLLIQPIDRKVTTRGEVKIENDVWIGENSVIMSGVTIGKNSVIGANTIVTHDVPPYSLCCGNPGKIIKTIK